MWLISKFKRGAPPAVQATTTIGTATTPTTATSINAGAAAAGARVGAEPNADAIVAIETVIRKFLAAYHPEDHGGSRRPVTNRNLWREVSSLTLLQLVAFVEQKFAIKVRPIDFAPQNFSNVPAIARFVAARQPRAADRAADR